MGIQTSAVYDRKKSLWGDQGSSEKAELKRKFQEKFWIARGNYSVVYGEEGCSRQGAPEHRTTGEQSPRVPSCTSKRVCFFSNQNWTGEYRVGCTQWDRVTGVVAGHHQRNEKQSSNLEKHPLQWHFKYEDWTHGLHKNVYEEYTWSTNSTALYLELNHYTYTCNAKLAWAFNTRSNI